MRTESPLIHWLLVLLAALVFVPLLGVLLMMMTGEQVIGVQIAAIPEMPAWMVVWLGLVAVFLALLIVLIVWNFIVWFAGPRRV